MESSSYELNASVTSWEFLSLFIFRPLLAIVFVLSLLLLGWFLAWKLVLVHVPLVQEIFGLRNKPVKPKPENRRRFTQFYNNMDSQSSASHWCCEIGNGTSFKKNNKTLSIHAEGHEICVRVSKSPWWWKTDCLGLINHKHTSVYLFDEYLKSDLSMCQKYYSCLLVTTELVTYSGDTLVNIKCCRSKFIDT